MEGRHPKPSSLHVLDVDRMGRSAWRLSLDDIVTMNGLEIAGQVFMNGLMVKKET